jgi:glycine/D-amino acid oxidase-like deaminating enzyme
MSREFQSEIAVLGAGVVGLAVADALIAAGRDVVVVDPGVAGMGASYGNAGTIADYAVMPVGSPDVLRNIGALLFDKNSPLSIRTAALPSLLPWLTRFAWQSLPQATLRNATSIAALLLDAKQRWVELAARIGAAGLMQNRGCLYLYETDAAFLAAQKDMAQRRALGVNVALIDHHQARHLEPNLTLHQGGVAYFPDASFLNDPGALVAALARSVFANAQFINSAAISIRREARGVRIEGADFRLNAKTVVIAAGAHSKALAAQTGDRIPLDTERGYHVEWDMAEPLLTRPCCPTSRGFYLCPMQGRLRVAGTVELGGLTAPPSRHRIENLIRGARAIFPELGEPNRHWMGFRPSIPDSVPVIGPSKRGADVIHAYGHGHIGLTLAPITGQLVTDYVMGRTPQLDMRPYLPSRF